jgi:hypothetical protein
MDENPANRAGQFNYGLTLERATQYLAEHGDEVSGALLLDWPEFVRPLPSLDAFVAKHATPLQSRAA